MLTFSRVFCCCIVVDRHWLTARSEQVMAKGKGLMQTYWCDPSSISTMSMGKVDSQLATVRKVVVKCVTKYNGINVTDLECVALSSMLIGS
jgi:hypothetical protein